MATTRERDAHTGTATTGHEWDGIKKLDTTMPSWWIYTFYASIAFAVVWMVLYPSLPYVRGVLGYTTRGSFAEAMAAEQARAAPMLARMRAATPAGIADDPALRAYALSGGRVAFATNCAGCHGSGG